MCSPTDVSQVIFFKTQEPIEPVSFVHRICSDAVQDPGRKRSRWTRRLTPMSMMSKATEKGLEEVTKAVLAPHFHVEGVAPKKVRYPSHSAPMAPATAAPLVTQDITAVAMLPVMGRTSRGYPDFPIGGRMSSSSQAFTSPSFQCYSTAA